MSTRLSSLAVAALLAMSIAPFANVASAMPVADALVIKNAAPTNIETVQYRGYYGRGYTDEDGTARGGVWVQDCSVVRS